MKKSLTKEDVVEIVLVTLFTMGVIILLAHGVYEFIWMRGCEHSRGIDTSWNYCDEQWAK